MGGERSSYALHVTFHSRLNSFRVTCSRVTCSPTVCAGVSPMLATWPPRNTIGPFVCTAIYIDQGPRSPHPMMLSLCIELMSYTMMTGRPLPGASIRITSFIITLTLFSTFVLVKLVGLEVSRALWGAHPFHLSCGVASGDCRALRDTVPGRHCYWQPLCLPA